MNRLTLLSIILAVVWAAFCKAEKPLPHDEEFYKKVSTLSLDSLSKLAKENIVNGKDDAILYYSIAVARYSPESTPEEKETFSRMLNNLGYLHFYHNGDPVRSYNYVIRSLKIAQEIGSTSLLPHIYLNLANIYCTLDDYESAMENFKKSIAASSVEKSYDIMLISLVGLANLTYTGDKDSLGSISKEIELFRNAKMPSSTPLYRYTELLLQALREAEKGNQQKALALLDEAGSHIDTELTPERYGYVLLSLKAAVGMSGGDYPRSAAWLRDILSRNADADIRAATYYQLWKCYQKTGQNDSIAKYSSLYLALADTMLHSGQLKVLRDIEAQANMEEYDRNISSVSRRNKTLIAYGSVISTLLIILLFLGWRLWMSRKKLVKANEELYKRLRQEDVMGCVKSEDVATGDDAQSETVRALVSIMEGSPEIYSQNFSIDTLAQLAGLPVRKVSQAINSELGLNFSTFLQKYRIKEACRRLDDKEHYGDLTIEAISESLGFKSRGNFVQIFKKLTGMTPSAYQQISRRQSPTQ